MQLSNLRGSEFATTENVFELSLNQAVAGNVANAPDMQNILSASKLNKVTQLTGFSDPVYAEAYVHVNQYDIVLDVLIVNQTGLLFLKHATMKKLNVNKVDIILSFIFLRRKIGDTLQNCTLELATLGDLKLVEKPQPIVLAPHDFCNIKANVKVASTENGIIFGNIGKYTLLSIF